MIDGLVGLYVVAAVFGLGYSGIIPCYSITVRELLPADEVGRRTAIVIFFGAIGMALGGWLGGFVYDRSEEHTSELQSLMRISYAVFCLKKKKDTRTARH